MVRPAGKTHVAYLALGSNVGAREKNIAAALHALSATRSISVTKISGLYETRPVGGPAGQAEFLNGVARIETSLSAERFLEVCGRIEASLGRRREVRWGPRTIDLDILLFDQVIQSSHELTIPHPLMHERRFVLEPLAEIAPDLVHPTLLRTCRELLEELAGPEGETASVVFDPSGG